MDDMNGSRIGFETASGAADFDTERRGAPSGSAGYVGSMTFRLRRRPNPSTASGAV
jgi:hypothetical protein